MLNHRKTPTWKTQPLLNTPTPCALEEGEMSINPETLSLAITLGGGNRLFRWSGLHFENTVLYGGKFQLATGFSVLFP